MEGDPQSTAAAEAPPAESTAPSVETTQAVETAPPPPSEPASPRESFEAGFRARDERGRFARAEPDEPAAPAASEPEPPKAEATAEPAPAEVPAPGATPEIPADVLTAAVEREMARREQEAADKKAADEQAEAERTAAQERREAIFGKDGEMAALLRKQAAWNQGTSDDPFTQDDLDRLTTLVSNAERYEPMRQRAVEDAQAEIDRVRAEGDKKADDARAVTQAMLDEWAAQIQAVAGLGIDGIDAAYITSKDAEQLTAIVEKARHAGRAERDDEVEDLKAQLAEAKASAFGSQPQLVTAGGASPSGRGRSGLPADASPREAFAEGFAQRGVGSTNGRR